jgi:hypothetical protein
MPKEKRIVIKLCGERVPLSSLVEAVGDMERSLGELDHSCTGSKTVEWDVVDLAIGSAEVAVEPRIIVGQVIDSTAIIIRRFRDGIDAVRSWVKPDNYPEKVWGFFGRMKVLPGIDKVSISVIEDEQTKTTVEIDRDAQSQEATGIADSIRTSYGSVEGKPELLNGFKDSFDITDRDTGRRIRCFCSKEMLSDIAKNDWERYIVVTGEITEDSHGNPKSIQVERRRPLARGPLPQIEDLLGLYVVGNNV